MPARDYLPSTQFIFTASSLIVAGILIVAAYYLTSPQKNTGGLAATDTPAGIKPMDWQKSLATIQEEKVLAEPPDIATLESLRTGAQTSSITGTVARNILLNLSAAKAEGLGSDFPTQEQIVADAAARATIERGAPAYTTAQLTTTTDTPENMRVYGNSLAAALAAYPKTAMEETLLAVSNAVDTGTPESVKPFTDIKREYAALTSDLLAMPIPATLLPLHLQVLNNFARMTDLYADFAQTTTDPLRGISALRLYQSLALETQRLLINIARVLNESGILFDSDEPGHVWSLLLGLENNL